MASWTCEAIVSHDAILNQYLKLRIKRVWSVVRSQWLKGSCKRQSGQITSRNETKNEASPSRHVMRNDRSPYIAMKAQKFLKRRYHINYIQSEYENQRQRGYNLSLRFAMVTLPNRIEWKCLLAASTVRPSIVWPSFLWKSFSNEVTVFIFVEFSVEFYNTSTSRVILGGWYCLLYHPPLINKNSTMARSGYAKGANSGHVTQEKARPARPASKKMVSEV